MRFIFARSALGRGLGEGLPFPRKSISSVFLCPVKWMKQRYDTVCVLFDVRLMFEAQLLPLCFATAAFALGLGVGAIGVCVVPRCKHDDPHDKGGDHHDRDNRQRGGADILVGGRGAGLLWRCRRRRQLLPWRRRALRGRGR